MFIGRARPLSAGENETTSQRFPSDLCIDKGRAINAAMPDWLKILRGEPAEIDLRLEDELKPRGFHLTARVLEAACRGT